MAFNPFFFNDSPLSMELIYKALLELGDIKPTVDELKVKVDKLIADLDGAVAEEVARVINEMYENGQLAELIESYFDEYANELGDELSSKSSILDFERCYRILRQTAHYMWQQPDYVEAGDDTREAKYSFCQGSCSFYRNGELYNAFLEISNDGSKFSEGGEAYTGTGKLEIYKNDGTYVKDITLANDVGHGQSLTYHNGYFYFSGSKPSAMDSQAVRKIRRFPFDWNEQSTIESYLMPYDINGLASYNGELYMANAKYTEIDLWRVDMDVDGITPLGTVSNGLVMNPTRIGFRLTQTPRIYYYDENNKPSTTIFSGGFSVTEKYYYFGIHKPSGILRCKRNFNESGVETNFTPDWFYNIPYMLNDMEFKTGEIEGLTVFDNGDCYLITTQHLNTKAICEHDITQVFCNNLYKNTGLPYVSNNPYTGRCNIYLDSTYVDNQANGTKQHPFYTIDEACWWFNNTTKYGYGKFTFNGAFPHVAVCVSGKTYYFDGKGNEASDIQSDNSVTLIGNLVAFGGTIHAEYCRFFSTIHYLANSDADATRKENLKSYIHQKQNPIYAQDCVLTLLNCGCSYSNNGNLMNAIYCSNVVGNFNYSDAGVISRYGQDTWEAQHSHAVVFDDDHPNGNYAQKDCGFMRLGTCMVNVHGVLHKHDGGLAVSNTINLQGNNPLMNFVEHYYNNGLTIRQEDLPFTISAHDPQINIYPATD